MNHIGCRMKVVEVRAYRRNDTSVTSGDNERKDRNKTNSITEGSLYLGSKVRIFI